MSNQKQIVALSRAEYRGVQIFETPTGCKFYMAGRWYDCLNLNEAVALIDAIHVALKRVVVLSPHSG